MSFDISSLVHSDTALLKLLTNNLPDMLWIKDLEGKYIYANKATCDGLLMAKNIEEPIGKDDVFFALRERKAHKDKPDWHTFGELCLNSDIVVIENNRSMKFEEYGNVKGKLLYLEVNKAPFYDNAGNIIGTVGSGRDITELKLTQIKLKQQYETIKEQSKMVSMGEMIANIVHQWRQPLSVISTAASGMLIQKEYDTLTDDSFKKSCSTINDNAQYLSSTINDFRNYIKGDRKPKEFNLKNSTETFLKLVDATIKENNIKIILNLIEDINLKGYPNELIQCFINIFNNAKDVLLENNREENRYIFISHETFNNTIIIKFKDNAGGIPQNIISKIFEPYFTTKHASEGTGLGLHMTYNLITEGMHGNIEANNTTYIYEDKEHVGAEFIITLFK